MDYRCQYSWIDSPSGPHRQPQYCRKIGLPFWYDGFVFSRCEEHSNGWQPVTEEELVLLEIHES